MLRIYALLAVLLVSACSGRGLRYKSPYALDSETQRHATVSLQVLCVSDGGINAWKGSGIITGKHTILTANHVAHCDGESLITVELMSGALMEVEVTVQADDHDIAKLRSNQSLPWFSFRIGKKPEPGDLVCSESAVPTRARKCGEVQHVSDDASNRDIMFDLDVESGNSGSGVFNEAGDLIGIVTLRHKTNKAGAAASLWQHRHVMKPI